MLVDCGGGTVDMTVHEIDNDGKLTELLKATGGAYGGIGKCNKLFHWLFCCSTTVGSC